MVPRFTPAGTRGRIARDHDPVTSFLKTPSPVSLLAADRDAIIPFLRLRELADRRSDVRFVTLPAMTHELENRALLRDLIRHELNLPD